MNKKQKEKEILVSARKAAEEIMALQFKGKKLSQKKVREVAAKMARAIPA